MQIKIGLSILAIFLFFRPVTVSYHHIGSISILDIYGVAISYLIVFGLLLNINRIQMDLTSFLILFFVFYCGLSYFWGSAYHGIFRIVLPFLPFFLTKTVLNTQKNIIFLLQSLVWGYFLPIFGSICIILLGLSDTVVTGSLVERQAGLSSGPHTLGHLMLFFSFLFAFLNVSSSLYCWLHPNLYKYSLFRESYAGVFEKVFCKKAGCSC